MSTFPFPFGSLGGCHVDELGRKTVDFLMFSAKLPRYWPLVDHPVTPVYRLLRVPDLQG
jgi:hypothetical protein